MPSSQALWSKYAINLCVQIDRCCKTTVERYLYTSKAYIKLSKIQISGLTPDILLHKKGLPTAFGGTESEKSIWHASNSRKAALLRSITMREHRRKKLSKALRESEMKTHSTSMRKPFPQPGWLALSKSCWHHMSTKRTDANLRPRLEASGNRLCSRLTSDCHTALVVCSV